MVSSILFGWVAEFGKTLTITQWSSQPDYSNKWLAPITSNLIPAWF